MAGHSVPRAEQVIEVLRYARCAKLDAPPSEVDAQHYRRDIIDEAYKIPVTMFKVRGQRSLVISIQGTDFSQFKHNWLNVKLAMSEFLKAGVHKPTVRKICKGILSILNANPQLLADITVITVVGHSRGGYIAQYLSIFGGLKQYNIPVCCWVIDSPGLLPTDLTKLKPEEKQDIKARHYAILSYPNIVNTLGSHECNVILQVAHLTEDLGDMEFDSSSDEYDSSDSDEYNSSDSDCSPDDDDDDCSIYSGSSEEWSDFGDMVEDFGETVKCLFKKGVRKLKTGAKRIVKKAKDKVKKKVVKTVSMAVILEAVFKRLHCHRLDEILCAAEAREIWHMHRWPQLMDPEHPFDEFTKILESMSETLPFKYIGTYLFHRKEFDFHPFLTAFSRMMENYEYCHYCHGQTNRSLHYHERLSIPRIISSRLSHNKCVDVCDSGGENSGVLVWDRHGGENQKWFLQELEEGFYRLVPCHNQDVCLSGLNGRGSVKVEKKTADDIPEWHVWRLESVAGGYHRLRCMYNNQYLAVSENNTRNTQLIMWGHVSEWGQHWKIEYAQ